MSDVNISIDPEQNTSINIQPDQETSIRIEPDKNTLVNVEKQQDFPITVEPDKETTIGIQEPPPINLEVLEKGATGQRGLPGVDGKDGENATVAVGSTQTVPYGEDAQVTNSGTPSNVILDFSIPEGKQGDTGEKGADSTVPGPEGPPGLDGTDGQEVLLQKTETFIQWKYENDVSWTNLVALADLRGADGSDGADGREIELQVNSTHIQWKYTGGSWTNLIALSALKGDKGDTGSISSADSLTMTEITTPANPDSGTIKIYTKDDGKVYKLNSDGLEEEIGTGGGGADILAVQVFS